MNLELLHRLGQGKRIETLCGEFGIDRAAFDEWWRAELRRRLPSVKGSQPAKVKDRIEIRRDVRGVPHIFAETQADLYFGFGYAVAQDRLFQLDYLRRKGLGRLSEILGSETIPLDRNARTIGLNRIAQAEWERLDGQTRQVLESFSAGINSFREQAQDSLPIEFGLLDYQPEPWTPIDSLAIECEFRWYLTGRFPVIAIPELAKRTLGVGDLYDECILGEPDDEAILWPGEYPSGGTTDLDSVGAALADPDAAIGSNNWVIGPRRSETGSPMLANDPHIAFEAVSCWYLVHLCGASTNVAGMAYVGMPGILVGRNDRVSWGITNNICSQRDLYQEKTSEEYPGCFLFDGEWEQECVVSEEIKVRGHQSVTETIRHSRNGPVIDALLPKAAQDTGPVTVKWLGAYQGGWLTALLGMSEAGSADELRQATRPWHVPTFAVVVADVDGNFMLQATGRIPMRQQLERGYRRGWDPDDQWQGLLPFESMPHGINPQRQWIASANNRVAADDFPYNLFGCWGNGGRAQRIRNLIEETETISAERMKRVQYDYFSLPASVQVPQLLSVIEEKGAAATTVVTEAMRHLRSWDYQMAVDSVAATVFSFFTAEWQRTVAAVRFSGETAGLMATAIGGCAARLLAGDRAGWFAGRDRENEIYEAFERSLVQLESELGPDVSAWTWGRIHRLPLKHVLGSRGDLGELLNHGGASVPGDVNCVANTGLEADWTAGAGAGFRMLVDMAASPAELLMLDAQSQSGNPGSDHYADQFEAWLAGDYHRVSLDRNVSRAAGSVCLELVPENVF